MRVSVFVVLAVLGGGCHWNLNDPGTDPLSTQLYFPTGIAMDPTGRYAYVSNGNADLKYGGGTVQMIDVAHYECAVEHFRFKHGLPGGASGRSQYCMARWSDAQMEADTQFPWCQQDPLDPTIVDCDEDRFIINNATVKLGNFAGSVRLMKTNDGTHTRRLFISVRGDPSVTYLDVDINQRDSQQRGMALDCGHKDWTKNSPPPCTKDHLLQVFNCRQGDTGITSDMGVAEAAANGYPFCPAGTDDLGSLQIPTEPFGVKLDQQTDATGKVVKNGYAYLLVSHLSTGQVSLIDATGPTFMSTSQQFFPPTSSGLRGAFMLAPQHPGDATSTWYMTSNQTPIIATFHVADVKKIVPQSSFTVQATFQNGSDLRDIIFDVDGNRAFVTENNPPTVLTLDTHVADSKNGGGPANLITSAVDVCQTPSHMALMRLLVQGAPGTPPRVKNKLVVVCFLSSQVMIVDPDRPGVDGTIYTGFGGPNDLAFTRPRQSDGSVVAEVEVPWEHAWVTNYSESTIAIVDLAPGSATENRVIARLGLPQDGPQGGSAAPVSGK